MRVHLELSIGGVDGETHVILTTVDTKMARQALALYDHEGSTVTLRAVAEDENVFQFLDLLEGVTP